MSVKIFEEAKDAILNGDDEKATDLARRGLDEGVDPLEFMEKGFIPAINEIGELFMKGRIFIPALIMAAIAMEKATAILKDAIPQGKGTSVCKIVIGTVEGDVHDIGKTIVVALFKANGFDVLDIGRDVPVARFIEEAEKFGADIIGSSTLLTTTMGLQRQIEEELKKAGIRDKYKTIIGGAPVTQRWADKIGADAYAQDATDGVRKIRGLLSGK